MVTSRVVERRHGARLAVHGSVIVHTEGGAVRGRIKDLAAGGVRIVVERSAELRELREMGGGRLRIELRLDGHDAHWLRLLGHAGPIDARRHALSIRFDAVPQELEDLVQDQLLAELECQRKPRALVIDPLDERRAAAAAAFARGGFHVTTAHSPLEAVDALDESGVHAAVIAFAADDHSTSTAALRRHVARAYPEARLVAIAPDALDAQVDALTAERRA